MNPDDNGGLFSNAPNMKGPDNYRTVKQKISRRMPTRGSTLRADWYTLQHPLLSETTYDQYVVWSYNTVIATWDPIEGWRVSDQKYSNTTARHLNLVRATIRHYKFV